MNDSDLIDELRKGMNARIEHTELAAGSAVRARRVARRRAARRTATAGTPLLAVAGVATVLLTNSGSRHAGGQPAQTPSAGISAPGGHAQDVAYVVKRVRARLAADSDGVVMHVYQDAGAQEAADGSLSGLGNPSFDQYAYDTPDGAQYQRTTVYGPDGKVTGIGFWKLSAPAGGQQTLDQARADPAAGTYQAWKTSTSAGASTGAALPRGEAQVEQALQSGAVTQLGTTTFNGTAAIALAVDEVQVGSQTQTPSTSGETVTLYVDAHTYQPLATVIGFTDTGSHPTPGLYIAEWLPLTQANIDRATDESIPNAYTRVAHTG